MLRPALLGAGAVGAAALAVLLFAAVPILGEVEARLGDRVRLALAPGPVGQDPRISFVALDEATLATLPYRSPIDRGLLADVLDAIAAGGATAVGIDVLIDQPTEPEKDARLAAAIRDFPGPVVVAWAGRGAGMTEAQSAWLAGFAEASGAIFGDVTLAAGSQGVVREAAVRAGDAPEGFPLLLARSLEPEARPVDGLIDWRRTLDPALPPFQTSPAHVLPLLKANPAILGTWFGGRIVIVGADLPLQDRHETPLSVLGFDARATPGAVIHAHIVSQMLDGRRVPGLGPGAALGIVVALCALVTLALAAVRMTLVRVGVSTLLLAGYVAAALFATASGWPVAPLAPAVLAVGLTWLAVASIDAMAARRDRQYIEGAFSHYLAPELVARLVRDPAALSVGGERREMSFLFTDIAGFTTLSEQMEPERMTRMLNAYLDGVCAIIIARRGVIDKFIGDAVVALFGVPEDEPGHAANAIACAREIDAFAEAFRAEPGHEMLGVTRIGVHTGTATVGNFGGEARFDYTAIGDAMNTAARLEGANKYFGTRIAVSDASLRSAEGRLPDNLAMQPIGDIVLKGKSEPLGVQTIRADNDKDWLERYAQAYLYLNCDPAGAETLLDGLGDDPVVRFHLDRLRAGEGGRVIVMTEK